MADACPIDSLLNSIATALWNSGLCIGDEKALQSDISDALTGLGVLHEREHRLSKHGIVDFWFAGGLACEVKIKGSKREIRRQLARYAAHPDVNALLLITARTVGLPECLNGKPLYTYSLSKAML